MIGHFDSVVSRTRATLRRAEFGFSAFACKRACRRRAAAARPGARATLVYTGGRTPLANQSHQMSANRNPSLQETLNLPFHSPSGRTGLGAVHYTAQTRRSPLAAASRLSSFRSQTRTWTVIGRSPREPSRCEANSVSRFRPTALSRWERAHRRCECSPALRKKRAIPATLSGRVQLPHLALKTTVSLQPARDLPTNLP